MQYNKIINRVNVVDLRVYLIRESWVGAVGSVLILAGRGTKAVSTFGNHLFVFFDETDEMKRRVCFTT